MSYNFSFEMPDGKNVDVNVATLETSPISRAFIEVEAEGFIVTSLQANASTMKIIKSNLSKSIDEEYLWTALLVEDNELNDNSISLNCEH